MNKKITPYRLTMAIVIFGGLILIMWFSDHPYEIYHKKPLPGIELTRLDGTEFSSADWMGKPIAINIMASWCGPCRQELPELEELNKHLPVYAIATQDSAERLEALFEKKGNPFRDVGIDNFGKIMMLLRVNGIPTTLFLDSQHRIAFVREGAMAKGEVKEKLMPVIEKIK